MRLAPQSLKALADAAEELGVSRNYLMSLVLNRVAGIASLGRMEDLLIELFHEDEWKVPAMYVDPQLFGGETKEKK